MDIQFRGRFFGQQHVKAGAAFRAITGVNLAAVHLDNRLANGEPQADAGDGGFFITASEFSKDSLLLTSRNAGAAVPDFEIEPLVAPARPHAYLRPRARIFGGVFQQVNQHPLKERAVDVDKRQRVAQAQRDMPPAEARLQHLERAAYHFFQRQPLFAQVKTAGLNARHIQQIIHQSRGVQHMLANFARLRRVF